MRLISSMIFFLQIYCFADNPSNSEINIDLNKYQGHWHQIAAIPTWFQKDCSSHISEQYTLQLDEELKILSQCKIENGEFKTAHGKARVDPFYQNNSKLEITYTKTHGHWSWLLAGTYWVLRIGTHYEYSVVGDYDHEFLWILSRNDSLPLCKLASLELHIREQNYDTCKIIITQSDEYKDQRLCDIYELAAQCS